MSAKGKILGIYISHKRGIAKNSISCAQLISDWGIRGDAHAGKWNKQICLFAIESLTEVPPTKWKQCQEKAHTENITIVGLSLEHLSPKTLLKIGHQVILRIESRGKEKFIEDGRSYIISREGRFCTVLHGGQINVGDKIEKMTISEYEEFLHH